jgi:hypothetical protein
MSGKKVLETTRWFIREEVASTKDRPFSSVNYWIREQENLTYAIKRAPLAVRSKHPNLDKVRDGLIFWGQKLAVDFLMKLYEVWTEEMALGYRTSAKETHGYHPKIFLGDISQRGGGPIKIAGGKTAHLTHQHGSQIDIYYFTHSGDNKTVIYDSAKSDEACDWNRDLNTRLLRAIFKAGGKSVLTECEPFFAMDEFKGLIAQGKIRSKPPHRDHFHVELT